MIVTTIRIAFAVLCMIAVYGVTLGHGAEKNAPSSGAVVDTGAKARSIDGGKSVTKGKPAQVTPQGGISFGEQIISPEKAKRMAETMWPGMTQDEINALTAALKALKGKVPVDIVCMNPQCEDLALNLDNAFESAKWKSNVLVGTQFGGVPPGITASSKLLADILNGVTSNRYAVAVDQEKNGAGEYIAIGAKPRK